MVRIDYKILTVYFVVFVLIQLPLLYKFVFLDSAFGFFYLGFLLLLPLGLNPFLRIFIGFAVGLIIDIFSSTPGLHASACTLVMYLREYWLRTIRDDLDEDVNLSIGRLGFRGSIVYMIPLLFLHLLIVFSVEHGKWIGFGLVVKRVLFSTIFTFTTILILSFLMMRRRRRI